MARSRNDEICVYIDSGANVDSCNKEVVHVVDLGFDSREEWDNASDEDRENAIIEYWAENGYPEIGWTEDE